ncbi:MULTISPECIES: hypothetical protein [Bacillaceae]|uniref:hypothetical protein n=1 Tax=Bacillaceae TaxID=186817 RepID=UPI001BDE35D0|nr:MULTISPECIES: hypothetical protein [Bacillaceae]MDX8361286.1 hypothetical protein [Cytobacillus sp. IB215316]
MTRIPNEERAMMELAIYLPMLLIVLNKDLATIQQSNFKLKKPYVTIIEQSMKQIQIDLRRIKKEMYKNDLKVCEVNRDEAFTDFLFIYKGYEERHNYFNPRIRNKVQDLMIVYLQDNKINSAKPIDT